MLLLFEAYAYALDTRRCAWDFAVDATSLHTAGLGVNDLRWLAYRGFIAHTSAALSGGNEELPIQLNGRLTFTDQTLFVLTDKGAEFASRFLDAGRSTGPDVTSFLQESNSQNDAAHPCWLPERRELHLNGSLVKRYKWQAMNQETVLAVFEEEGWPHRIDDPLPQAPEQDPKRRLSDTIKCLNRKQTNRLVLFRGDGAGEGVVWDRIKDGSLG
jgi:hypothetical protein